MLLAISSDKEKYEEAQQLSHTYNIPLAQDLDKNIEENTDFLLHYAPEGLTLVRSQKTSLQTSEQPIHIDFLSGKSRHRRLYGGGKGQNLAKAIGLKKIKQPSIIDATAGLGKDAFVLATLGCKVTLLERALPVYLLLQNALERAQQSDDEQVKGIVSAMNLLQTNSQEYLQQLSAEQFPDIIYFDPMFPDRDKSAKVKKEMSFFKELIGKDEDAADVLQIALSRAKKRIVVKRPRHADFLGMMKPNFQILGKSTRYDIYLPY